MRKFVLAAVLLAAMPATAFAGDVEAGKKVYNKCKACHQVGKNGAGPHLDGVSGRKAGSLEDYQYSAKLKEAGFVWDDEHLDKWLENPRKLVPGTKMVFMGLKKPEDRANLIAYLKTL